MNNCNEYFDLISADLDGALTPEEAARLDAHLETCPDCRKAKAELEAIHAALLDLPTAEPPAGLYDRIMEAVAADNVVPFVPPVKKKPAFRWQKWAAAAAMFAVIIVGYGAMNGSGKEIAPPPTGSPAPSAEAVTPTSVLEGQPKVRSIDASDETTDIQAFSNEEEPMAEAADVPLAASEPPVPGTIPPQETAPTIKTAAAQGPAETPAPEPTPMLRSFLMTSALPPEETPVESDNETGDTLDAVPFALPVPEDSGDDEETPEKTEPMMTARQALERLLEEWPMPGCETWEYEEIEEGWQSPSWMEGTPEDDWYCSCWLQYNGTYETMDGDIYHSFSEQNALLNKDFLTDEALYNLLDWWTDSPVGYGVPADGGEIIVAGN